MKVNCTFSRMADADSLIANPKNPNMHSDRQIQMLAKILNYQGWRHPVVVSKRSGFIVAGHGRLMAAKRNGWDQIPVDEQDFENEAAEHAFLIADNKIAELSNTDDETLKELARGLGDDFDHDLLGLDADLFKVELPEMEHEGLENLDITIRECPHCKESFEESQAKIIG